MPHPNSEATLRVPADCGRDRGEPLGDLPEHKEDGENQEKGARTATERDEFGRAAWRVMVAAPVDPESLVFVDECELHTSLAPFYGYAPEAERLYLPVPRTRGKNTTLGKALRFRA